MKQIIIESIAYHVVTGIILIIHVFQGIHCWKTSCHGLVV